MFPNTLAPERVKFMKDLREFPTEHLRAFRADVGRKHLLALNGIPDPTLTHPEHQATLFLDVLELITAEMKRRNLKEKSA